MKDEEIEDDLERLWKESANNIANLKHMIELEEKLKAKIEDLISQAGIAKEFGYIPNAKVELEEDAYLYEDRHLDPEEDEDDSN